MSKYNEYMKDILTEVDSFLQESLKFVTLTAAGEKQKQLILDKLDVVRLEYPFLLPAKPRAGNLKPLTDDDSGNTGSSLEEGSEGVDSAYSENIANISAGEAIVGCVRSGMLLKKRKASDLRSRLNPFQKRWCIIKQNIFYYFEKSSDKQQKGAFSLAGYHFREAPFLVKDENKKELGFQLYSLGSRTYEFLAASRQDIEEWKAVIEGSIKEKPNSIPTHSSTAADIDEEIYEPIADGFEQVASLSSSGYEPSADSRDESSRPSSVYQDALSPPTSTSTPVKPPDGRRPPPAEPKRQMPDPRDWKFGVANDYRNMYYGKWDCVAEADNELGFKQWDIVHVLSKEYDSDAWWIAELDGNVGLVPKKYLVEAYERVTD